MAETNIINAELDTSRNKKSIEYVRPSLTKKIFANLVDAIIFVFVLISSFSGVRAIVTSTEKYSANNKELINFKLDSGLFEKDKNGVIQETTYILDTSSIHSAESRRNVSIISINKFFAFSSSRVSTEEYTFMQNDYKSYRLNCSTTDGVNLFIEDGENVIENPSYISTGSGTASPVFQTYYEKCYKPYINEHLMSFLNSKFPRYLELNKYLSNIILFAELLPAFLFSMFITYLLPTIIFSRGRMTFGKRIYKIALLDNQCLSPSFLRTLARFFIILLEFVLAIPSFCMTFIISFSMMVFSKSKQSVPDYVAGVNEILILDQKIFKNFDEVDLETIDVHKEAVKFTTKNFD